MLSSSTVYAIRASIFIAAHKNEKYLPISTIAEKLDISFHFLTKILQKLTQINLMTSYRGPNGGVSFTKPTNKIFLIDIVDAVEPNPIFSECLLGIPGCADAEPCPLHEDWGPIRKQLRSKFEKTNLADLANKVSRFNERLK
ncbi:MAG: Rrf2 family transcriptional regulator [Calditrichaeota bacterium]|nr:MAG: Rrf2 family transcriptional regulator [Calditrichota bacterium]MBL1206936.1 Rrf2 family transcriptional regulator [Calditrichota bacterium]NOG46763.1 Rrf2 family transcriptional regulator [Calditrichota bacterium]